MKGLLSGLTLAVVFSTLAFSSSVTSHARLTPVKATHYHRDKRVKRHRAHKTAKHHAPKHHHHTV